MRDRTAGRSRSKQTDSSSSSGRDGQTESTGGDNGARACRNLVSTNKGRQGWTMMDKRRRDRSCIN